MMAQRRFLWGLALVTLLALFLNGFHLARQPVSEDDFNVALSAINYMESGQLGPTMWNHPCLRNILVYGTLRLFGPGVLGTKGVSLILGTLCSPLMGLVARRMFRNEYVALTAALLWACDALVIDFSRQGINDIYLAFFPLAAIYLLFRFRETDNQWWLVASGISFGLGLASKWSVLFPMVVSLILLLIGAGLAKGLSRSDKTIRCCHAVAMLVVVPFLVYLLTFLPWFGRGYSLEEWPALQRSMFLETSQHAGYQPKPWDDRDNRAYKWFIVPSLFADPFVNLKAPAENGQTPSLEESATVVLGVANPLVWLLALPAFALLVRNGIVEREERKLYLAALFLCSYLPLVISPRPIWLNTALSVLPYAIMAVAWFVWYIAETRSNPVQVVVAYIALVLVTAAPLYLLATGKGMQLPSMRSYLVKHYLDPFKREMPVDRPPGVILPSGGSER